MAPIIFSIDLCFFCLKKEIVMIYLSDVKTFLLTHKKCKIIENKKKEEHSFFSAWIKLSVSQKI